MHWHKRALSYIDQNLKNRVTSTTTALYFRETRCVSNEPIFKYLERHLTELRLNATIFLDSPTLTLRLHMTEIVKTLNKEF